MNIVWFKKDLRVADHKPLVEACKYGEVMPIYVVEPAIWKADDLSIRHYQFVLEGLEDLAQELKELGGRLFIAIGEMEEVLEGLFLAYGSFRLFAHRESGTFACVERNVTVRLWMDSHNLPFYEYQNFGVLPGLKKQANFKNEWISFMNEPLLEPPAKIRSPENVPEMFSAHLNKASSFKVKGEKIRFGQVGGEHQGKETLQFFLKEQFKHYEENYEKPLESFSSSSRLSPYITWGNLSIRTVVQQTAIAYENCDDESHKKQLSAFQSNLFLHCQMIQQLENDSDIQKNEIHSGFNAVRTEGEEAAFLRWYNGKTGIPMVDAAMRCLHKTGWLNVSARAMLVSFVCNTLLMNWKKPASALAQLFLDYEPGIHYNHVQKIAGMTNSSNIKMINPVKMGKKNDPNGDFVRRYVPELKNLPPQYIHEPWLYPGFYRLGYETPMVDIVKAHKTAKQLFLSVKIKQKSQNPNDILTEKHTKNKSHNEQLSWDL
jgi:deoxyribodipyrimidine photo-lyase